MGYGVVISAFLDEIEKLGVAQQGQQLAMQSVAPRSITNPTNVKVLNTVKPIKREASSTRPGGARAPNPSITARAPMQGSPNIVQGSGDSTDVTGLLTRVANSRLGRSTG